ncbi:hypothetical protein V1512DRAFT_292507 [Lipomyces arxii]|uniref:uncharacterized protein n=1 Tax=Lipomyces arxii TaxID=56418 RepID=UPI0034CF3685
MSLRGMKKAVIRAPHVLIGNKSPEDLTIIDWTKAIAEAEKGIDEIIAHAKKFRDAWIAILSSQVSMAKDYKAMYEPIPEEDETKSVRLTPPATMAAIIKYKDVIVEIQNAILPMLDSIDRMVVQRCVTMKGYIETIKKVLKKREHKKIDYDRYTNSLEKIQRKAKMSDKDEGHLEKTQKELEKATEDFRVHDEYVKDTLPKVIIQLSEFIAPLATLLFQTQTGILQISNDFLYPFAQQQGLAHSERSVVDEWSEQFIPIQHQVEEGIATIRNGKAVKQPMTVRDSVALDQKIKRVLTVKKNNNRPKGTGKDGVYRTFSDLNQSAHNSEGSDYAESLSGFSTPGSPVLLNSRTFSSTNSIRSSNFETLPKYQAVNVDSPKVVAGSTLWSSTSTPESKLHSFDNSQSIDEATMEKPSPTDKQGISEDGAHAEYDLMTAQYTFVGTQDTDLSFNVGDKVKVFMKNEDDWWEGETMDGKHGEFPGNYVK